MRTNHSTVRSLHRELYRSLIKEATRKQRKYTPRVYGLFQENFIRHISTNTYFTPKERKVLVAYFDQNRTLNEAKFMQIGSRVLLRESTDGKMNEGLSSWLGGVWDKIKTAFGNLKKMITDVIIKIKNFLIESGKKMYDKARATLKGKVDELTKLFAEVIKGGDSEKTNEEEEKNGEEIKKAGGKPQLLKEGAHLATIADWANDPVEKFIEALKKKMPAEETAAKAEDKIEAAADSGEKGGDEKVDERATSLQESWKKIHLEMKGISLFDEKLTRILTEEEEALPTDVTNKESVSKWLKAGKNAVKVLKIVLTVVSGILSPIGLAISTFMKAGAKYAVNLAAHGIEALGGPKAIKYLVIPACIALATKFLDEVHHLYDAVNEAAGALVGAIPVVGNSIELGMKIVSGIFMALGVTYIVHYALMSAEDVKDMKKPAQSATDLFRETDTVKENYLRKTNRYPGRVYALK